MCSKVHVMKGEMCGLVSREEQLFHLLSSCSAIFLVITVSGHTFLIGTISRGRYAVIDSLANEALNGQDSSGFFLICDSLKAFEKVLLASVSSRTSSHNMNWPSRIFDAIVFEKSGNGEFLSVLSFSCSTTVLVFLYNYTIPDGLTSSAQVLERIEQNIQQENFAQPLLSPNAAASRDDVSIPEEYVQQQLVLESASAPGQVVDSLDDSTREPPAGDSSLTIAEDSDAVLSADGPTPSDQGSSVSSPRM